MGKGQLDLMEEFTRLQGRAEYFEPADELRNLFVIACLLVLIPLLGLMLILIYTDHVGCQIPGVLLNLVFYVFTFLYIHLGRRFVSELEDENEYDPDVLYMVDIKKARTLSKLIFVLGILFSAGAVALGFILRGGPLVTYLSAVQIPVMIALLIVTSKEIKVNDIFKIIVE